MAKMLLSSTGCTNPNIGKELLRIVNKPPGKIKVLFITTAARTKSHKELVIKSRKQLLSMGMKEENIVECILNEEVEYSTLNEIDVIHVCGGYRDYLLKRIRDTHFDIILKNALEDNKVYFGVSAGSVILSPKAKYSDGLNIIDVFVFPHYCDADREIIEKYSAQAENKIICLTDVQALEIISEKYTIIE